MAKLVALYTVVVNVLANAGLMVSDETAKQIRQVCTWANVKFAFPKLEDAVMDFYMLSLKYYRLLHERKTHPTDDWLARNMVKAFRQNRDENKFGGVIHLLEDYIQKETNAFLKGELDSVDFMLEPEDQFINAINSWIREGQLTVNGEALRSRLVKLFNLGANQIIMHVSKEGIAKSFRLVSTFGQKDEQIDVEAEEHLADECQVSGIEEETHVVIPTGFVPFSNQAAAVMNKSVAAGVGIIAHPALQNLANDSVKETAINVGVPLDKFNVKPEDIKRWQLLAIGNRIAAKEKAKHTKWEERKDIYPPSPEEVLGMLFDPAVENDIYRAMIVSRKEVEKAAAKEKKQVTEATVSSCTKSNVAPSKKDDIVITIGDKNISMRINASRIYASYIRGDIRMKDDSKPAVKFSWGINPKTGKPYEELKAEKYDKALKRIVQMRSYSIVDGQKVQTAEEKKNASILNCIIAKLKAMDLEPIANASINTWGQKGGK